MAFVVSGALLGAAVIGNGIMQSNAAGKAARAQEQASQNAIQEQQRQYDLTRADYGPYRQAGYGALNNLTATNTGDYSNFYNSPGYNFARTEGQRGVEQSAAARGGAASGNALKALAEFNQGLASQQYGNWWNQQQGLVNAGLGAATNTAVAGSNAANNISQGYLNIGDARASGVLGQANAFGNVLNTGLNLFAMGRGF